MKISLHYSVWSGFALVLSAVALCSLTVADDSKPAKKMKCPHQADDKTRPVDDNSGRMSIWVDLYRGEPLAIEAVMDDLAGVGVIYLGERHTLARHHDVQTAIVDSLVERKIPVMLGLEQMESRFQIDLDRYSRGEIDFEELAEVTEWSKRWSNYRQYRSLLEAARKAGAPILGLNAKSQTIRQVARSGGLDNLDPDLRRELPDDIQLDDPIYEQLLGLHMRVHRAATPKRLRPMIEAQICRDEMMASVLCSFLRSERGKGRTAVVICGAGHASYGLGTAARVRRRIPGIKERIVLLSESGDVKLSPHEKAMARPIRVTHEQLRGLGRPIADYLHVRSLKPNTK